MKRLIPAVLFSLCGGAVFASGFEVSVAGAVRMSNGSILAGREVAVEYSHNCEKCPVRCSFTLKNSGYDMTFWNGTGSVSFVWSLIFGEKNGFMLKAGPGAAFSYAGRSSGFSPEVYARLSYSIFYAAAGALIFSDGLFMDAKAGCEWEMGVFLLNAGISGIMNTDHAGLAFMPGIILGAAYVF